MASPRNSNPEQKKGLGPKASVTEIRKSEVEGEVITQEFLAHISQANADADIAKSEADRAALLREVKKGKRTIHLALARGATVEPGPLRVVRGPQGQIDIV